MSTPKSSTPDQLEADIERQRDELAATVTELQARLDVKARVRGKAEELKQRATSDSGKPRPELAAAAVAVVALVGIVLWRRRR